MNKAVCDHISYTKLPLEKKNPILQFIASLLNGQSSVSVKKLAELSNKLRHDYSFSQKKVFTHIKNFEKQCLPL